jgi:hypothetical protein
MTHARSLGLQATLDAMAITNKARFVTQAG